MIRNLRGRHAFSKEMLDQVQHDRGVLDRLFRQKFVIPGKRSADLESPWGCTSSKEMPDQARHDGGGMPE